MTKTNNAPHGSNFWFGFALGISGASALAYFLGTQKGRETAKKVLEYAEKCEDGSDIYLDIVQMLNKYAKQGKVPDIIEGAGSVAQNLDTLIEKVKHITDNKTEKDIFINHK